MVEFDAPFLFHIGLTDEERGLGGVRFGLKAQVKRAGSGRMVGKLGPFRGSRLAEMDCLGI